MELQGGTIGVESEFGQGGIFTVARVEVENHASET
jgi:hypothetical protein